MIEWCQEKLLALITIQKNWTKQKIVNQIDWIIGLLTG